MPDFHSLEPGVWPANAIRNNGPDHLVLERLKLRELAEGWPCYRYVRVVDSVDQVLKTDNCHRDACEWENFKSLFFSDAHVYTTWSGRVHFTDFMNASQAGMDKGAFIMHRCHGVTTDITPDATRAVTKMKATITQRFTIDGCEVDVEADCRFCFFFEKVEGVWGARYVRHWYEKDKMIPVNPAKVPVLDEAKLEAYPQGYKFLAYSQELTMNVSVSRDMPGHRRHAGTPSGEKHDLLYRQGKDWLDGKSVDI